jgi:acyl-lipid omega-6 desaturase (Delta-12 desaturase)
MANTSIHSLRGELKGLQRQSTTWASFLFLSAIAMYIGCFVGAGFLKPISARIPCCLALGPLIALLFRIAHDAGHESHFTSRRLNRLAGYISILPSYHPYSVWLHFHNARHHTFTNLRSYDYLWVPLTKREYDHLFIIGRALERCYRTMLGVGLYYFYAIWWKKMLFPRRSVVTRSKLKYSVDSIIVLLFFCAQVLLLSWGANGSTELLARVVMAIVFP